MEKLKFFKTNQQFRTWLNKNYARVSEIWLGFHKKSLDKTAFTYVEALDTAMCFGWTGNVIRSIDESTYRVKFLPRKPKSSWSLTNIKKFKELRKKGLVNKAAETVFNNRDTQKSQEKEPKLLSKYIKIFKQNKVSWEFFSRQTKSYKKYMAWWVTSAKQEKTQLKRLSMLIADSAEGSKLKRIVQAVEKIKNKNRQPGQTPIEQAKNIGPVCGAELRSLGITTFEKLQSIGWEEAFYQICEKYPNRINLNMAVGLAAAVEEQDWRKISPNLKAQARKILEQVKRDFSV